jgi:tRNA-Thr(GGU) m(6)t(6)A37 methyltransferase TsaA
MSGGTRRDRDDDAGGPSSGSRVDEGCDTPRELTLTPIGVVRSPYSHHPGTPRQATRDAAAREGRIVLHRGMQNTLHELATFSHVWILYWMHHAAGKWNEQVRAPRDGVKRGVFATRAPHRPNPIGLSVVELVSVRGVELHVRGLDILDGSPVLDLKPYVPYADRIEEANGGWTDALALDEGPDHRDTRFVGRRWWSRAAQRREGRGGRPGDGGE